MDDLINELGTIAEKFKKNNRINKPESDRVDELLTQMLVNRELRSTGLKNMLSLPVSVAGSAFVKAWEKSDDNNKAILLEGITRNRDFEALAGFNRVLEIVAAFIKISLPVASTLFMVLSDKSTSGARKKAHPVLTKSVRKLLIDNRDLLKINLTELEINPRQITAIAVVLIQALLERQPLQEGNCDTELQFLTWLGNSRVKPGLPSKLMAEIEQETSKWPEVFQRRCIELGIVRNITLKTDSVDSQIQPDKPPVSLATNTGQNTDQNIREQDKEVAGSKDDRDVNVDRKPIQSVTGSVQSSPIKGNNVPQGNINYPVMKHLEMIGNYVMGLESKVNSSTEKLNKKEAELEIERHRRINLEKQAQVLKDTIGQAQTMNNVLNDQLRSLQNKLVTLESDLEKERQEHALKVKRLVDQTETESSQAVVEFKNILAQSLRLQFNEFKDTDREHMTMELGEHLRFRLRKIFSTLSNKGINFE